MQNINPQTVDQTLNSILQPEDKVLNHIREWSKRKGLPDIEVSEQQGKMLELLVRIAGAKEVLEIGTLGAYSTVCLARGAGPRGYVTTLEYEALHAQTAIENLQFAGLHMNVNVIVGDAHKTLESLEDSDNNRYDFVFIDADKESNWAYVQWALRLGTKDVTIVVDNVIRDGRILDPARGDKLDLIRQMADCAALECSVVQTVGAKGWDGFILARRTNR